MPFTHFETNSLIWWQQDNNMTCHIEAYICVQVFFPNVNLSESVGFSSLSKIRLPPQNHKPSPPNIVIS